MEAFGHRTRVNGSRSRDAEHHSSFRLGRLHLKGAFTLAPAVFSRRTLNSIINAADFTKFGFDLLYEVKNKSTGEEVARAKTGIVCFDYSRRKVARIPEPLLLKLQSIS